METRTLRGAVKALRSHHGAPEKLPTADPFELVLWDNVAYLAPPAKRREAHLLLQHHGRTLCRRSAPLCVGCPLHPSCAYARPKIRRRA